MGWLALSKWKVSLSLRWLGLHLHLVVPQEFWFCEVKCRKHQRVQGCWRLLNSTHVRFMSPFVGQNPIRNHHPYPSMLYKGLPFLLSRYDFGEFLRILDADTTATEASEKHQEGWCCIVVLHFLTCHRLHLHVSIKEACLLKSLILCDSMSRV